MRRIDNEEVQIRRIGMECQQRFGMLRHPDVSDEDDGTDVRVEVEWAYTSYPKDEDISGGFYHVIVPTIFPDPGMSEDELMENHPATLAENLVNDYFQRKAEEREGDFWWQIDDISSF